MNFVTYLANGFGMLRFDKAAVVAVATDPDSKSNPITLTAILAVLVGLGLAALAWLISSFPFSAIPYSSFLPVIGFIVGSVGVICILVIGTAVLHGLARILGGQSSYLSLYGSYVSLQFALFICGIGIGVLSIIPIIGTVIQIAWLIFSLSVLVFVIREVYQFSTLRAVVVALIIPVLFLFVLGFIAAIAYFGALSPDLAAPKRCLISAEFRCEEYQLQRIDDSTVTLTGLITNLQSDSITIASITAAPTVASTSTCTLSQAEVVSGQRMQFTCELSGITAGSSGSVKVPFTITYRLQGFQYDRVANGELVAAIR